MRIRSRLLLVIIGLVLIGALSGTVGLVSVRTIALRLESLVRNETAFMFSMSRLQFLNLELRQYEKDLLINAGDSEAQQAYLTGFNKVVRELQDEFSSLESFVADGGFFSGNEEVEMELRSASGNMSSYVSGVLSVAPRMIRSGSITAMEGDRMLESRQALFVQDGHIGVEARVGREGAA